MAVTVVSIPVGQVRPLHEPNEPEHLRHLTESMRRDGWHGRPILVYKTVTCYQAITGSHRIAAARVVGLALLPCVVIADAIVDLDDKKVRLTDRLALCDNSPPLFAALCTFNASPEVVGLMALDFLARPEPDFDPESYDWGALGEWMLYRWKSDSPTLELPCADELGRLES